jgi:hypothetical protein
MKKYLSLADLVVISLTLILFLLALFTQGFTHDLFLEAGVLLISVKIIMMNYKLVLSSRQIMDELNDVKGVLREIRNSKTTGAGKD